MKELTGLFFILAFTVNSSAQYYYKDIEVTRQTIQNWKLYKANRVRQVKLSSFESNGEPTPGFDCRQSVADDFSEISTHTSTNMTAATSLIANYDQQGFLKKTVDTSDTYQSSTEYEYDAQGRVSVIRNISLQTDNQVRSTEIHIWNYNAQGQVSRMLKIKNDIDSTLVDFVLDEKGNVIEEHPVSHRLSLPVIYYYYDGNNRMTDIVRYNEKANRLLPDYIFERDPNGRILSMLFLPAGTNEYQKWVYEYDEKGLKKNETCFNRRKELLGRISYEYEFRK